MVRAFISTGAKCMPAATDIESPPSGISDWLLELVIGIVVLVLGISVWAYTHFGPRNAELNKPKPAWLPMPKVMAQTADGRMFNVKINLRLREEGDVSVLEPHIPAFKAMVQEAGTQMSRDDMKEPDGLARFSKAVKTSVNGYLKSQDVLPRVKDVDFEELMLLP